MSRTTMKPQPSIVERLDFVAKRIPGLKFTRSTQQPGDEQLYGCFMSCDMYYIEIKVDQSQQTVEDVIISHTNSPAEISCPVLRKVLVEQDFETFAKHLSGLHSIYQINTNKTNLRQKAYAAITALENDLTIFYGYQRRFIPSCHDLVHKSPIGVMEPRRGGLPVKLTYFITPYDLVDASKKSFINLSVENIIEKNLGLSATVQIEGSSPHKIQIKSLITRNNQSNLPRYNQFDDQNAEELPAQFVLKLCQPLPMLNTSISQIIDEMNKDEPLTIKKELSSVMKSSKDSIISLIARQELDLNKGLFGRTTTSVETLKGVDAEMCDLKRQVYSIKLPDQHHTYHIIGNYLERPEGVYIEKIPFTHPTSIPKILRVLRQQALFNFVIGSCICRNRSSTGTSNSAASTSTDENNSIKLSQQDSNIFDILPVNLTNVCISFEHPSRESLATVEIDLEEIVCRLYALDKESVCSNEFATKTLQKCWSIPVTMRSVLRKCNETRLVLLEDSNKRRERELQELLATNSSTNHKQPSGSSFTQETLLQSKLSNNVPAHNDKSANSRDLNSIAEFLSNKVNSLASATVDRINQASSGASSDNNRTNLLKKFSCKPKVKQTTTTSKGQTGNKILSLMLKRQSSTAVGSNEDPNLKGPVVKKAKTKNVAESTSTVVDGPPPPILTTTKLISPDVAMAARLASIKQQQQTKQSSGSSVLKESPISLIKAPKPVSAQATSSVSMALSSNASILNQTVSNIRLKSQMTNGTGGLSPAGKSRKSSIGAVLDRLVGNVTPEQQSNLITQLTSSSESNQESPKGSSDSSKPGLNGAPKKNSKAPGGDQFAIKQGSSGGGLKLTVTKTKPNVLTTPLSSSVSCAAQPSAAPIATTSASAASTTGSTLSSSSTSSGNPSSSLMTSSSSKQSDASKILELGSVAPSIRYTIPKISKTQTASQSTQSHQTSSDINTSSQNDSSASQTSDDTTNPSSSGNQSSAPSSTATANLNKRTTSNPFNRNIGTNRNSVSSSTHPNRTTSNPLANASSNRPSSSTTNNNSSNNGDNNNHTLNRMNGGTNQNLQQRQPIMNRSVNLFPQPHFASPSSSSAPNPVNVPVPSRLLNPASALLAQQQAAAAQLIRQQPALSQMFSLRLPQQSPQNIFSNVNDLNLIASQVALLNQQQQLQQQQAQQLQLQQQVQQHIQQQQQLLQSQAAVSTVDLQPSTGLLQSRVTSSSEAEADNPNSKIVQSTLPSSTPSSPTECGTTETVVPPPLIPIDSLDEAHPVSPDVDHDDESDRLSIVDMNEHATSDSMAGTPKPSGLHSPIAGVQETSPMMGPSAISANHRTVDSSGGSPNMLSGLARSQARALSSVSAEEAVAKPETSIPPCEPLHIRSTSQNVMAVSNSDSMNITQSPQSSIMPSTTATNNLI